MLNALKLVDNSGYTYADYASWPDDDIRRELIGGVVYMMSRPTILHQIVNTQLSWQFASFLKGKPCKVITEPEVRLFPLPDQSDDTVVAPDLIVVCNRAKLGRLSYNGVPDLVVEILSPSTAWKDRGEKCALYERAGVKEYWIVDPQKKTVRVHLLQNGAYASRTYTADEAVPVAVLFGCVIDMPGVWAEADELGAPAEAEEFFSAKDIAAQYGLDIQQVRGWAITHKIPYLMQEGCQEYLWDEDSLAKLYSDIGR
ncbi:MAG: Uma2 family endonuclease, partial [Treponema sp.]|nr:Uma2 family endonuclease [Treponema sp.]